MERTFQKRASSFPRTHEHEIPRSHLGAAGLWARRSAPRRPASGRTLVASMRMFQSSQANRSGTATGGTWWTFSIIPLICRSGKPLCIEIGGRDMPKTPPLERCCFIAVGFEKENVMTRTLLSMVLAVAIVGSPHLAVAAGGGGGGGGGGGAGSASGGGASGASAGGTSSGPSVGSPSAAGTPSAGSAGAGLQGVNGVPSGPANTAGLNNAGNDPSGAGNSSKTPDAPGTTTQGTNTLGTANSSGSPAGSSGVVNGGHGTVGMAGQGSGGRIDGTVTSGPALPGDATIRQESTPNSPVDQKLKICKGC